MVQSVIMVMSNKALSRGDTTCSNSEVGKRNRELESVK